MAIRANKAAPGQALQSFDAILIGAGVVGSSVAYHLAHLGYGFSGHGFKLSPAVGRVLAQEAPGLATNVPLTPCALERFRRGQLLVGKYGPGAVS